MRIELGYTILFGTQILIYMAALLNLYIIAKMTRKILKDYKELKNKEELAVIKGAAQNLKDKEKLEAKIY